MSGVFIVEVKQELQEQGELFWDSGILGKPHRYHWQIAKTCPLDVCQTFTSWEAGLPSLSDGVLEFNSVVICNEAKD